MSSSAVILCSVPQGSVLGPWLFILYTADLSHVANEHHVTIHMFTNDTQLYLCCGRDSMASTIVRLQHCITDINHWIITGLISYGEDWADLDRHKLLCHCRKCKFPVSAARRRCHFTKSICSSARTGHLSWSLPREACFKCQLLPSPSTATHPALTVYRVYYNTRARFRDVLSVMSVGAPKSVTSKLQQVLNVAARVVSGTRKFDRGLMQLLHADLHWLEHVVYKLCMMMCWCQDGTAPQYMTAYWTPVSETASWQHLRLAASYQLTVLPHRCVTYGGRAYAVASPSTWNSLPKRLHEPSNSATVFGHLLKTFFFWEYFGEMCYINRRFTLHYITLLSCDRQTNRAIASTRTSIASCR